MDNRIVSSPVIEWAATTNGVPRVPVVSGSNHVVIHTYDRFTKEYIVHRLNRHTGELQWSAYLPAGGYASPTIGNGIIYVPCGYSELCALNEETGEKLWVYDLKARNRSTPLYINETTVVAAANKIFMFNPEGQLVKSKAFEGNIFFGKPEFNDNKIFVIGTSNPTSSEERAFVYAIDFDSMELIWKTDVGHGIMISCDSSGPCFYQGKIFTGNKDGELVCLDSKSGSILWTAQGSSHTSRSKPTVHDNMVYVGGMTGFITGINIESGEVLFNTFLDEEGIFCPPIVYDGYLWVHSGVFLYVMDRLTGDVVNRIAIGHSPYTSFAIASGKLYIAAGDPPDWSYLYCLRLSNTPRLFVKEPVHVDYTIGTDQIDHLKVVFEIGSADGMHPDSISIDAQMFGGSSNYSLQKLKPSTFIFEYNIPSFHRFGNYALLLEASYGNRRVQSTLPICLREHSVDDLPKRHVIENFNLSLQDNEFYSGAAVLQSVYRLYGREISQEAVNTMGNYMDELGIDPHHKWRTGSVRILHASEENIRSHQKVDQKSLK